MQEHCHGAYVQEILLVRHVCIIQNPFFMAVLDVNDNGRRKWTVNKLERIRVQMDSAERITKFGASNYTRGSHVIKASDPST